MKVKMAKGKVSSKGALLLTSPSLFNPRLRFINEPVLSPTRLKKPSKDPIQKALPTHPRLRKLDVPIPVSLIEISTNGALVKSLPLTIQTIKMASKPLVNDPPMRPFQVFPSPRTRFPSLWILPPSIGHGPYPVFGSHFPHIIAKVLTK